MRSSSPRRLEPLVGLLFFVGLVCGLFGFWQACEPCCADLSLLQRASDALHSTLQLVILNVGASETRGWHLGIARLALPLATSLFVVLALWSRLAQWFTRIRLQLPPRRRRVAVVGCGSSGLQLARYYAATGFHVIGIDRDGASEAAGRFLAVGHSVIELDLLGADPVSAVPWRRFDRAIICTGDDFKDLAIARMVLDYVSKIRGHAHFRVTVTVDGSSVQRAAEFDPALARYEIEDRLNFLDLRHHAVRLLFQSHAPHVLSDTASRFRADTENPCHVALLLRGPSAEICVLQAVRALVYCSRNPLRVTVLTPEGQSFEQQLRTHYPALWPAPLDAARPSVFACLPLLAQVSVHATSITQINLHALEQAHRTQPIDVVYALGDSDGETAALLSEAIKAADVLPGDRPAVVAAFHGRVSLAGAENETTESYAFGEVTATGLRVHSFCLDAWLAPSASKEGVARSTVVDGPEAFNDEFAREHLDYYNSRYGGEPWSRRPEHERWYNRHAADHACIKLALVERARRSGDVAADIDHFAPLLAELEHRRYVIERALDGWVPRTDGRDKLNRYRLNPTLVPFDQLPERERGKDFDVVQVVKKLATRTLASEQHSKPATG